MSGIETTQTAFDNVRHENGSDQYSDRPIVDMSNPNEVHSLVRPLDSQSQSAVSNNGQLVFDNPYGNSVSNGWQGQWHDGGGGNQGGDRRGDDHGGHWSGPGSWQSGSDGGTSNIASEVGALSTELG